MTTSSVYFMLDGAPIESFGPVQTACQTEPGSPSCVLNVTIPSDVSSVAKIDPAAGGFELSYVLDASWDGFFTGGPPLATLLNGVDWSGTVQLTYGYAAVPEPTAWALMIVGFGAAGARLRGRRRGLLEGAATP